NGVRTDCKCKMPSCSVRTNESSKSHFCHILLLGKLVNNPHSPEHCFTACTSHEPILMYDDEGEMAHDCITLTYTPTSEITETPIDNAELELFVDGSAQVIEGNRRAGYAVTSTTEVVASGRLPDHFSAQAAELVALTRACMLATAQKTILPPESIIDLYKDVPLYEAWTWLDKGATVDSSGCWTKGGKYIAPESLLPYLAQQIHNLGHSGPATMNHSSNAYPSSTRTISWIEAYPTGHATAAHTAKCLVTDFIPRWGLPDSIDSDQGTHFTGQVVKEVSKMLKIKWNLHCPYRPQASGQVERANRSIKTRLSKMHQEGVLWVEALPAVLCSMRASPNRSVGLSPHEIITGRPMQMPGVIDLRNADVHIASDALITYCENLTKAVQSSRERVESCWQNPPEGGHTIIPGQWVMIKSFRNKPLEP
ncbi:hypothetical protein M9458_058118, partial [Cirrhinus mrigala]